MATPINTVTARGKLRPQHDPYWHRVQTGCYVGFRKMSASTPGAWVLRVADPISGKYVKKSLGALDDHPDHQRFDIAVRAAIQWIEHTERGGITKAKTVRDACEHYVSHLRQRGERKRKSDDPAHTTEQRLKNHVLSDERLANLELSKLTPAIIEGWRKKLRAKVQISGHKAGQPRSNATMNRDMTVFRAALNLALKDGWLTSDFAWRSKLEPIKNADGRRTAYLTREERAKLIEKAAPDIRLFLQALASLPLRPGALAALRVGDFDQRFSTLRIGQDKAGADRRVQLPKATAALFAQASVNKLPSAFIFTRADGAGWDKDSWYLPIKAAVAAAELSTGVTAYTLRHSAITDLVHQGLDLLTVAQLSGTSVAMIERHYGHMRQEIATAALEKLAM